jgi:hypothetical protein
VNRKIAFLAFLLMFSLLSSAAISAGQPGTTEMVFNKRFFYRIKPMMPYEQLVKDIGTPGRKTGEEKSSSQPIVSYRWDGGRKSSLEVKTIGGNVIGATMVSPRQHKLIMDRNGKIADAGN